jgi:hypothetical protein
MKEKLSYPQQAHEIISKAFMVRSQQPVTCAMTQTGFALSELYSHLVILKILSENMQILQTEQRQILSILLS